MRVLLDESVNWRLNRVLEGHEVMSTKQMGWDSYQNGALLSLSRDRFDAMITRDRKMIDQQNITTANVGLVILHSKSNSMQDLAPLAPRILEVLPGLNRGQVVHVYPP